ncbi:MAG: hypothetical protein LBH36_01260 [Candidatus Nomurabacteria bacterium]|nr:hypothetical protein [Candidatus Nomurabacteria bacterium]
MLKRQVSALVLQFIAPTEMISGLRARIEAVALVETNETKAVSENPPKETFGWRSAPPIKMDGSTVANF